MLLRECIRKYCPLGWYFMIHYSLVQWCFMQNLIPPRSCPPMYCTSSLTPDISRGDGSCTSRTEGTRGAEPTAEGNLSISMRRKLQWHQFLTQYKLAAKVFHKWQQKYFINGSNSIFQWQQQGDLWPRSGIIFPQLSSSALPCERQ